MERPVTFKNKSNQTLFGILHTPENIGQMVKRIGVNILNPGLKNRIAPNRLNIKIARMLCEKGFFVFRFDPHGIGDSEGQLSGNNENLLDMWGMIQKGEFVEDTIVSNSFFIDIAKLDKLILIGQCGAGVTALVCCGADERIDKLVLIDTPFRIVSSDISIQEMEADFEEPNELIRNGIHAIFNLNKIKNVMTAGFNWRLYFNAIVVSVSGLFQNSGNLKKQNINNRFNWQLQKAFERFMKRDGKICFIFAENDFSLKEFNQDFRSNFLDNNGMYQMNCKTDIIKEANHIYTEIAWQNELMSRISRFIT
jgi:hypothetical protein